MDLTCVEPAEAPLSFAAGSFLSDDFIGEEGLVDCIDSVALAEVGLTFLSDEDEGLR